MMNFSTLVIIVVILAALVSLLAVPFFYSRALGRREGKASLRRYLMKDQGLRQVVFEEQKKTAGQRNPPVQS